MAVTLIPQQHPWFSQGELLVDLFSVSDFCCVKKGNKYPGFIFILFFSREDRITSLRCPALSSLPRLILASFVTVLLKNRIEDATNIQCVSSELILFFTPSQASLLIFCTAAVLALAFLFMISAFL